MKHANSPAVDVTIGGQTRIYHAFITTAREGAPARSESGEIAEEKWLTTLDDFRTWLIREAA
jgi:hypothetical protein